VTVSAARPGGGVSVAVSPTLGVAVVDGCSVGTGRSVGVEVGRSSEIVGDALVAVDVGTTIGVDVGTGVGGVAAGSVGVGGAMLGPIVGGPAGGLAQPRSSVVGPATASQQLASQNRRRP
jgi:hypothetical protein